MSDFFDNIPTVPASPTNPIKDVVVGSDEIKRAIDQLVNSLISIDNIAAINNVYRVAQLYGRNCTVDSLTQAMAVLFTASAKINDKELINNLCENIQNTQKCINLVSKVDQRLFIAFILGYALSVFSEKNS